ncbi:transglycosylase SLT domain-containing protein [Streptomyces sp. ISL-87]|nr:transglycosylase SLT domain-containing protein [Streptomyces sp. ISL-87]
MAPVQAEYFWNDVWKGSGNIVSRGKKYMGHMFSMDTLGKVWDNLYSGVGESLGSIWEVVTNPIDAFTGAFDDIGDIVSGSYNNIIDMIETVKEIKDSPLGYASRVYDEFIANAEEGMPNLEGLFDFKNGSTVQASMPDFAAGLAPQPGAGGAGQWAPTALQAISMLGLPSTALQTVLYRIGMESGGDPTIVNKWDSNWLSGTPSVGLMQVIGPTFDAYAGPFRGSQPKLYGTSINPLANIYAGLNYATHRYGSGWQRMLAGNTGYATGTLSASPGFAMVGEKGPELVRFGGGERVYNDRETEALLNGKRYEIHVHEARNEPTAQAVMRALQTAEALYTNL